MADLNRRVLLTTLPSGIIGAAGGAAAVSQGQAVVPADGPNRPMPIPQQFGAVGDGVADDGAALAAWLRMGMAGVTLRLPSGLYRTTRSLDVRIGGKERALAIRGDGAANTGILMDGSVQQPALRIVGNMPDFDQLQLTGFRVERPDRGANGFGDGPGLLIENVRQFAIDDLRTFRNGCGLHLVGCLVGRIGNLLSYYDRQGVWLEKGRYQSTPNVIAIDNCSILASLRIGIDIDAGTCVTMRGTTIESTGIEAPGVVASGLRVRQSGLAGGVAINASALYFEDNRGSDIVIDHPDRLLTYGFTYCVFNRFAKSATAPSILFASRNGPDGARAILDVNGSTFLGHGTDYVASQARPAIAFDAPNGYNGFRLRDAGTLYQFGEEQPGAGVLRA